MPTIYKLKVTFSFKDYGDDGWFEEEEETITVTADTQEEAEALATEEVNDMYSAVRDLEFEVVAETEIPPGKILLKRNLVSKCGRYRSDGFIMVEKELGFTPKAEEDDPFTNPFEGCENRLGQPLGEYAVTPGQTAVFEAGLVSAHFVHQLNKIGVVICAVIGDTWPAPFALAKDGRYVGMVMPMTDYHERNLGTPEQRLAFIESQRESGGVFSQIS